ATAHIGLATMPRMSQDVNVRHMVGASNKVFDYMAAGLPLLVSDLADWQDTFVARGFGRACDPDDPGSVAAEFSWFVENAAERRAMAARNRVKVETDWNYDTAFAKVLDVLNDA
ncbi:MAG TPA: glycosyltransferase, partial [Hyphomicrobiaceae bacterium]|nr:glycosyltransferase [Hyphomicrobiaceae bacterium]